MGFTDAYAKRSLAEIASQHLTLGRFGFGTAFLALIVPATDAHGWSAVGSAWTWAVLGGGCAATGILAFYRAMQGHRAGLMGAIIATAPVLTAALESAFFEHRFQPLEVAGIGLAVTGAAVLALRS